MTRVGTETERLGDCGIGKVDDWVIEGGAHEATKRKRSGMKSLFMKMC